MVWKAATTDAGIKAAASHTANMTGSYDLYRAALRQAGLIEVDDVEPIVDIAKLFAQGRMPRGNSVGVLSISGGSGIVYADAAVLFRRHAGRLAPDRSLVRLAGKPGRRHGQLLQRHEPVHQRA
jgi:acyl-CoA synthetase (NDP forming)